MTGSPRHPHPAPDDEDDPVARLLMAFVIAVVAVIALAIGFLTVDYFLHPVRPTHYARFAGNYYTPTEAVGKAIGDQLPNKPFTGFPRWPLITFVAVFIGTYMIGVKRSIKMIGHFFAMEQPPEPLITGALWLGVALLYLLTHV